MMQLMFVGITHRAMNLLGQFHHDPDRSDGELDEIARENEIHFSGTRAPTRSYCAREGMEIHLYRRVAGGDTVFEIR